MILYNVYNYYHLNIIVSNIKGIQIYNGDIIINHLNFSIEIRMDDFTMAIHCNSPILFNSM